MDKILKTAVLLMIPVALAGQYYPFLGVHRTTGGGDPQRWTDVLDYASKNGHTAPSSTQQPAISTLVSDIDHILDKLDFFYLFDQDGSEAFGKINYVNPNNYYLSESGSVDWTSNRGILTISGEYYDTGFVPSSAGGNYAQDNACLGVASEAFAGGKNSLTVFIGSDQSPDAWFQLTSNFFGDLTFGPFLNNTTIRTESVNSPYFENAFTVGVDRSYSGGFDVYYDGSNDWDELDTSSGLPSVSLQIGSANGNSGALNGSYLRAAWGGGSLSATEWSQLNSALDTYFTNQ